MPVFSLRLGHLWRLFGWACLAALACACWDLTGRWLTGGQWGSVLFKLWGYWARWLRPPTIDVISIRP